MVKQERAEKGFADAGIGSGDENDFFGGHGLRGKCFMREPPK
jgi:hypothetical protein